MSSMPSEIDRHYELLDKLGEGGMGSVYKARHRQLGELRVIKVIRAHHADDPQVVARFRREARAAIDLRHPNVAQIHDFWMGDDGRAHLVMELIEGLTFQRVIAQHLPPLPLATEMARQSLAALGYLHAKGYLHRDVAPDNLMLTRDHDGRPAVKLIDLGLIKRDAETVELTATNIFVGKIRYASPELFRRPAMVPSAKSDLYSFATVFYELLTGVCPARGSSFEELMTAHLLDPPPAFDESDPEGRVPEGLRAVVLRALEKQPADRFESAEAFAEALEPFHDPDAVPDFAEIEALYGTPWLAPSIQRQTVRPDPDDESAIPTLAFGGPTLVKSAPAAAAASPGARQRPGAKPRSRSGPSPTARRLAWALVAVAALVGAWALTRAEWQREAAVPNVPTESRPAAIEIRSEVAAAPVALSQGRLSLDARPWAEIVAIEDADGRPVAFAGPLYTPTILSLAPGAYVVTLEHPDAPAPRRVEVRIPLTGTRVESFELIALGVEDFVAAEGLSDLLLNDAGDSS